ncbi:MAG: ribokinase [Microbacterium sp.]
MTPSVVVLGSANLDLVVRQPRRAVPGETIFGSGFTTGPGGKGLNQAVACARAGAAVSFVGAVGRDDFGVRLRATMADEGIDASLVVTADEPTGVAAITVTDDAENSIVVVPGANSHATLSAAERARIAEASFLVVQLERPVALVAEAMTCARAAGATTVLTPAPITEGVDDLLPLADILIPNEGEALALTGADDAETAACLLSRPAGTVIVTRGERGCLVARGGHVIRRVAAIPAAAADTTAAGDTFAGVVVAFLAEGADLDLALDAATAAAAIAVTRPGAVASMPARHEIAAAVAARRPAGTRTS